GLFRKRPDPSLAVLRGRRGARRLHRVVCVTHVEFRVLTVRTGLSDCDWRNIDRTQSQAGISDTIRPKTRPTRRSQGHTVRPFWALLAWPIQRELARLTESYRLHAR